MRILNLVQVVDGDMRWLTQTFRPVRRRVGCRRQCDCCTRLAHEGGGCRPALQLSEIGVLLENYPCFDGDQSVALSVLGREAKLAPSLCIAEFQEYVVVGNSAQMPESEEVGQKSPNIHTVGFQASLPAR